MRLTKEQTTAYKQYFIDCIYSDDTNTDAMTDAEKIQYVYDCFNAEYWSWHKKQGHSIQFSFSEWLSGLPSAVNLPFYNSDIIKLAESITGQEYTDRQAETILLNYFNFMAGIFFKLCRTHKIKIGY